MTSGIHHQWAQTHSALVGNSFRDYVIIGIVLGILVSLIQHWQLTYLVISGSSGMPWLCPRHRHCLRCLHCPGPHSPCSHLCRLCLLFITYFFQPRIYFVTAGVSFSGVRASDLFSCWHRALCLLSQPRSVRGSWLCVTVLIRSRSWAQPILTPTSPPVLLGCTQVVSLLSPSFCHRSNPGRVGLDTDAPAASAHCYSDEGMMEAKGSSPRML